MKQKVISGNDFLTLLSRSERNSVNGPIHVKDAFRITQGDIRHSLLSLEGITFSGSVTIDQLSTTAFVNLQSCIFLNGLTIERCIGESIGIHVCEAQSVRLWRCKHKRVHINGLAVDHQLDISGLDLSERLSLRNTRVGELELIHSSCHMRIQTPYVQTDNPVAALQFRMAGIPVFVSTTMAEELLKGDGVPCSTAQEPSLLV